MEREEETDREGALAPIDSLESAMWIVYDEVPHEASRKRFKTAEMR